MKQKRWENWGQGKLGTAPIFCSYSPGQTTAFRHATRTGRPVGSPTFVARLESVLTRLLQPKARGRPRHKA